MKKKLIYLITLIAFALSIFVPSTQAATTHTYQDVTAYTGKTNGHGGTLFPNKSYSTVAVHQKSSSNKAPMYPFGTQIQTKTALSLPGYGSKSIFSISDTGDLLRYRTTYWFDIYFGTKTTKNDKNARDFGMKQVSYTVYN